MSRKEINFPTNIGALIMAAIKSIRKIPNRGRTIKRLIKSQRSPLYFGNALFCPKHEKKWASSFFFWLVAVLARVNLRPAFQAGMAVHASEASTDLDEPGDKEIVLKNSVRNLSQVRLIMLKVKLCFWGNNSSFCTRANTCEIVLNCD
jgi:hypothetical protein